jgi:hypothetical protein
VTPSLSVSVQGLRSVYGRGGRATDVTVGVWTTVSFSASKRLGKERTGGAAKAGASHE